MKTNNITGILKEFLITLGIAVVLVLIIRVFILNTEVFNVSMQNTLIQGQRLFVLKQIGNLNTPQRGDIVIVHPPIDTKNDFVKRLIGLPGDVVEVKSGKVYINNTPLDEPYIKEAPRYNFGPFTVPENNYFVLGDNRNNSADSHTGWTVEKDKIVGKVWLRYWPLNKIGFIGSYPLEDQLAKK
jgi:signal peptidase I